MPMGLYVRLVDDTVSRHSFDILLYHILNQQAPKCGNVSGPHYDAFRAYWHSSGSGRTYLDHVYVPNVPLHMAPASLAVHRTV